MDKKKVVIFCPSPLSLITNSVCEILLKDGIEIEAIIVRSFNLKRFSEEFTRDGRRLLKKIWKKLVLREKAYKENGANIVTFRKNNNLISKNVKSFKEKGVKIITCGNLNDTKVVNYLDSLSSKVVLFTGGGIIRENVLNEAGDGIINCHMGILPEYKGMDLPEWALLEGNKDKIGLTLHFMDSGIDTGEILKKVKIEYIKGETILDLRKRFEPIMVQSMVETLKEYLNDEVSPVKQSNNPFKQYFIMHSKLVDALNVKLEKNAI